MSLEDEISVLRKNREAEQEARIAKEREEALAQLTPEAIARKLTELGEVKPQLTEQVFLLLRVNTPSLISEAAAYLYQQRFRGAMKLNIYKRRIEERDVPTVKIMNGAGEVEGEWRSFVRVRCEQKRQERSLRIGGFSDIGDGPIYPLGSFEVEVETQRVQEVLKMYVSGGRIRTEEPKELTEQSLRELIVNVLAGFKD